jgi:hypothetical protein
MQDIGLMILSASGVLAASFILAGCAPTPLEADYGHSVRQLSEQQVYDPSTLTKPSTAAVVGADPDMINVGLTTMRTQATDRKEVAKPVSISIGSQGGQ